MLEQQTHHEVKIGSERNFGLVFAALFLLFGLWPLIRGADIRWWSLALVLAFLTVTLVRPQLLAPLNKLWFQFGLLLGKVIAPVVMIVVYFIVVAPTGIVLRRLGKNLLHLKRPHAGVQTLWSDRTEPEDKMGSMNNQF